jgi:hypothetical protein
MSIEPSSTRVKRTAIGRWSLGHLVDKWERLPDADRRRAQRQSFPDKDDHSGAGLTYAPFVMPNRRINPSVAGLASALPAGRAARIEPAVALRET